MNFLEQLAAEWYQHRGYFVRTNLKFGGPPEGRPFVGEMDVAAFHPATGELVHVETSMSSAPRETWERKFATAQAHFGELFKFEISSVRRIAIVGFGKQGKPSLGEGIEVKTVPQFIREVCDGVRDFSKIIIPEGLPLLRAMQLAINWGVAGESKRSADLRR